MGFTPLVSSDGVPSPQALLERVTGICCCYNGGKSDLESLLAAVGGGSVLLWLQDPTTLPPDYAVTFSGGVYTVWIAGTVTAGQLLNQVSGNLWTQNVSPFGIVNGFWLQIAQVVSIGIALAIVKHATGPAGFPLSIGIAGISTPSPVTVPGIRVEFVGDSYGSGIATVLASAYSAAYGDGSISLCAFGSPKVFVSGYNGPKPGVWLRPHRNADPVPYLPPTVGFRMTDSSAGEGADTVGRRVVWQHYGDGLLVRDDGTLAPDPWDTRDSWLSLGVFLTFRIPEHLYGNVAGYLENLANVPGGLDPQGLAALAVLDVVRTLPRKDGLMPAPAPTEETATDANAVNFGDTNGPLTPSSLPQTQLAFVTGTQINWLSPATTSGGNKVALTIRPPADQTYLRVTLFLRANGKTASESHFYNSQSTDASTLKIIGGNLMQRRMACSPTGVTPLRYRVSVVGRPRVAQSYLAGAYLPGLPGTQNISADSVVCTLGCQMLGVSPPLNKQARIFMSFPTDLSLQDDTYYASTGVPNDPAYDGALSTYLSYLVGNGSVSNWGTLALGVAQTVSPVMSVTGIAVVANSPIATVSVVTPPGGATNMVENDVVGLSRIPAVSPLNPEGAGPVLPWNQNWYVAAPAALAPGPGTFTIKLGAPATLTGSSKPGGFAQLKYETFWRYTTIGPIFAGERRRGVRAFQPLGRRKIRRTVGY